MLNKKKQLYFQYSDYSFQLNIEYTLKLPYWSYKFPLDILGKKKHSCSQCLSCKFQLNTLCKLSYQDSSYSFQSDM